MAKPRELFNTPAPQAMSQMGAGIADAYANVGRMHGQGMAAMGESIGKGIQAAVGAYAGYTQQQKQIESQNKSYENLFKNPLVQNMFFQDKQGPEGVITAKEQASQFLAQTADMKPSEKNMFFNTIVPPAIGQYYKMQQLEAEQKGLYDRAVATKEVAPNFSNLGQGLRSSYGEVPAQPTAMVPQEMGFDATSAATRLQDYMIRKYGSDYRTKGIKASSQDVMDAGL